MWNHYCLCIRSNDHGILPTVVMTVIDLLLDHHLNLIVAPALMESGLLDYYDHEPSYGPSKVDQLECAGSIINHGYIGTLLS